MTAQSTTARKRLSMAFRTPAGAIDLASIMVGVIVLAVIAIGGVAATVFAAIPWAQDGAAKAALHAYQTAQSVAQAKDGRFMTTNELVDHGYLPEKARTTAASPAGIPQGSRGMSVPVADPPAVDDGPLRTALNADGTCYVANLRSGAGTVFYVTSKNPTPEAVTGADPDTRWCVGWPKPANRPGDKVHLVTESLPDATVFTSYDHDLEASGPGPIVFAATGLPTGLTITNSGKISGTPTVTGSFTVEVTVSNSNSTQSREIPLTVSGMINFEEDFADSNYATRGLKISGTTYYWPSYSNTHTASDNRMGVSAGQMFLSFDSPSNCMGCTVASARMAVTISGLRPNATYKFSADTSNTGMAQLKETSIAGHPIPTYSSVNTTWTANTTSTGTYSFNYQVSSSSSYGVTHFKMMLDNLKAALQ